MKIYLIILAMILLISSLVLAENQNITTQEENAQLNHYVYLLTEQPDYVKELANGNMDKIPGYARTLIGDEKINIYFITNQQDRIEIRIELKNGKVDVLEEGTNEKPDIEITATENDIDQIINSENPRKEAKNKLDNKAIIYKTHGFFTGIKVALLKNFL